MKISSEQPKIIVVGSCSLDLVMNTDHTPYPNETILASHSEYFFGGKGMNQAVGTARLGASTYFIGCVGMDPKGQQILRRLVDEGVNAGFVAESETKPTGRAYVMTSGGKNSIVIVPAANHSLSPKHIDEADKYFHTADLVLIQLEVPMEVVEYTVKKAKKHGVKVGIYAAPAQRLSEEIIDYASFLVVKNNDCLTIFGKENSEELLKTYANKLFLRDNANETLYHNGFEVVKYKHNDEEMPHKMGMNDAFISGYAIALCHRNTTEDCVSFGSEISSKVSKTPSSQAGIPHLKDIK